MIYAYFSIVQMFTIEFSKYLYYNNSCSKYLGKAKGQGSNMKKVKLLVTCILLMMFLVSCDREKDIYTKQKINFYAVNWIKK